MESRLRLLKHKAGPVLFQLPPQFSVDPNRLESFLRLLRSKRRYAFEFRHPSWYRDDIFEMLKEHDVSLCLSDHHDAPTPWLVTVSHVFVRGHGPGGPYCGHYPRATLESWARHIRKWKRQGRAVYVYFDNDQKSAAPKDALQLAA